MKGEPPTLRKLVMAAAVLATISLLIWFEFIPSWWEQKASADWPSVQGRIVECQLRPRTWSLKSPPVHVLYTYQIGVRTLQSSDYHRIGWSASSLWYGGGGNIVDRLKSKSTVKVWYDPDHPERATLRSGVNAAESAATWGFAIMPFWAFVVWLTKVRTWWRSRTA